MPRQAPAGFPVNVDGMMEASNTGIAAIRRQLSDQRKEMREEKGRCGNPSCNKEEGGKISLRACSRCHSVRYCSTVCQREHWQSHRTSCQSLVDPPLCRSFNPKYIPTGCKFPSTPIFARGDKDGVGCWCSSGGQITCDLAVKPGGKLANLPSRNSTSPEELMSALPGVPGFYLELRMMVQNRTKEPRIIVGREIVAVIKDNKEDVFDEGEKPGERHLSCETIAGALSVGQYPAHARISNFMGKDIAEEGAPPPALQRALKDAATSALVLQPAEHVVFELQYRLGGPTIDKDFKAWAIIDHFLVPSVKHSPTSNTAYSQLHSRENVSKIRAPVFQRVLDYWYEDYVTKGEYAHIASHHGEERAKMVGMGNEVMGQHLSMMMGMLFQGLGGGSGSAR
ncbi:hypothetical protein BC629DRAFT_1521246 [Irpex lacteus]|nr:hypothetical protein BC629DRAFT_1521246 [Irpex lacteus]